MLGLFVFHVGMILRTSKSIGNNTMKKMLLNTVPLSHYGDAFNRTFTVQNKTGSSSTKGNHHLSFSFLELGRRKLSMQPKFVAAQKMLLKTETQQTFVNGLLGFITLGIYTR